MTQHLISQVQLNIHKPHDYLFNLLLLDESVNDDDSNSSEHIEGNKTINENYDNAVVDLTG